MFVNYISNHYFPLGYISENSSFYASLRPKFASQNQQSTLQESSPNNVLDECIE